MRSPDSFGFGSGAHAQSPPTMGRPVTASAPTPADPAPRGRSSPGAAGARAGGAGALARARRVRRVAAPARGRRAVGLLRGPADRERPARLPPRALARVQGHLPALSDDARLPGRAQGRLGLPRAARGDRRRRGAGHPLARRRSRSTGSPSSTPECRESVFAYLEEWNRLTERIGFWLDLDDAYRTLDETYIESVWWALAQIDERGLLYEGHKVVPYCPRCETTLSSHEVALGYQDIVDPSVFLKLPVIRRRRSCSCGRPRRGRSRETWRWRSRPRPPTPGCGSGMRCSCLPRPASSRCSGRRQRSSSGSRARSS